MEPKLVIDAFAQSLESAGDYYIAHLLPYQTSWIFASARWLLALDLFFTAHSRSRRLLKITTPHRAVQSN